MAVINVYEQYFEAEHTANGVERHAELVMLTADSGEGRIRYEAAVTFFPHRDEEDFAVSYDDYHSKVLFESEGRRSGKRDRFYRDRIREEIDQLLEGTGGTVYWDRPLLSERLA